MSKMHKAVEYFERIRYVPAMKEAADSLDIAIEEHDRLHLIIQALSEILGFGFPENDDEAECIARRMVREQKRTEAALREAREALSGRTVSCGNCNAIAEKLYSMRAVLVAAESALRIMGNELDTLRQINLRYEELRSAIREIKI